MNLSDVYAAGPVRRSRKRVGRGSGSGTGKTSGRGHKGQKSRSGYSRRAFFEGGQMPLFRRIPKRGFNNKNFRTVYAVVNVEELKAFNPNDDVTAASLHSKGLIGKVKDGVKILGDGDLDRPLVVKVKKVSENARRKIEKAGGTVEII